MDARARRLLAAARAEGNSVPDDDDVAMVLAWCSTPDPYGPPELGRYVFSVWRERVDLQEAYPGLLLDPLQRAGFVRWCVAFGREESDIPAVLLPDITSTPETVGLSARTPTLTAGVTVVGHLRSVLGIGAAARRLAELAQAAGEPVHRRAYDHTDAPIDETHAWAHDDAPGVDPPALDTLVLCVNGAQTRRLTRALGDNALAGRYRIGLWFWELSELPQEHRAGLAHLDEVWVTSEYTADAILRVAPHARVGVIPLGTSLIDVGPDEIGALRARLGIPVDRRVVGFAFDHASRVSRKNPLAVIEAYRRAFPQPDNDTMLVIKTVNGDRFRHAHERLVLASSTRPDVTVFDGPLTDREQQAFIAGLSAYVSLHRSEGYGLTMLEAMARGIPVIATGWSGNLAFTTIDNAWLVPFDLVPVASDPADENDPYGRAPETVWADPDVAVAAAALRDVFLGGPIVADRIERARRDVAALIDGSAGASWVRARLDEVRTRRNGAGHVATPIESGHSAAIRGTSRGSASPSNG